MKIFVTGGGGFLGLALVRRLLAMQYEVVTYSRNRYQVLDELGVTHVQGDLVDFQKLRTALIGCDAVFHTAAKTGIWGDYRDFYNANVEGTENVVRACREAGIRYLVFTSSPSVIYDGKNCDGGDESLPYPGKYLAHYPETKAMAEKMVMAANDDTLKTVSLRPHLIWGPGDPHFIPRLMSRARAGKLRIVGRDHNAVDCIYIDNAVNAHILALKQLLDDPGRVEGKTYFISQDQPVPIAELTNRMISAGDLPPVKKYIEPRIAHTAGWLIESLYKILNVSTEPPLTLFLAKQLSTSHWYDISAAKRDFGYTVEISLDDGIAKLRAWLANSQTI
jgi:2-alkyl-3-oxoalkanoate reductase